MYKKKKRSWVKHLDFIILDMLAAELALFIGVYIKFEGSIIFLDKYEWYNLYQNLAKVLPFIDLTGVLFTETYTGILRRTKYQELTSTIWHSLVNFGGILIYMYASQTSYYYSRLALGVFGTGMVLTATPMGNDTMLEIAFDKVGTKTLMANFAKMEIIK